MERYPELLRNLLLKRGVDTPEKADKFLNPDFEKGVYDPYLMHDMEKAVVRLFEAIQSGEKIVIYSDYDCDGIPGGVILQELIKKTGYQNFENYIPDRHGEGYGLNLAAIEKFRDAGVKLLITVDLGITAVQEVAFAQGYGIDVIITDHHLPQAELPRAFAILNPKIGENYPDKMICGSGVAFKLVQAFIQKYGEFFKIPNGSEKWMLDLVGLATLSDMVPLVDENRVFAYFGLKVLQRNRRLGLQKLMKKINVDARHITEDDIGFMIVPKLNAASRMDSPRRAFELLQTSDEAEAEGLADHLTGINDERKNIVANIMREVDKNIGSRLERAVIVIGNPKWRVGVLGLVASRLAEEYEKPAFVWGKEGGETIRGSCRSDGSVNLVDMMAALEKDTLLEFGGHALAGGFSVSHDQVYFLEEKLTAAYEEVKKEKIPAEISYDAALALDEINSENYKLIEKMAPFGVGNPKPVFIFADVCISQVKQFGKAADHLELTFHKSNGDKVKAISFFSDPNDYKVLLEPGRIVSLIANFEKSMFRGRAELRLRIVDII